MDRNEESARNPGHEPIGDLIAAAGRGPTANAEARERVYAAVHARWQATQPRRQARRIARAGGRGLALAASVAAAALVLSVMQRTPDEPAASVVLAGIARVDGDVTIVDDGRPGARASIDDSIRSGTRLVTGSDGMAELHLGGDTPSLILRINVDSAIAFVDASTIRLDAGAIYIDAGDAPGSVALTVETPLGDVTHLGTRYEVRMADTGLRVRVRDGLVRIEGTPGAGGANGAQLAAGEQLAVDRAGRSARSAIAPQDPAWAWTTSLASLTPADEYRVGATLRWLARESGLALEFATSDAGRRWDDEVVVGLDGLSPAEVLDVLGRTTNLRYQQQDDRLLILN
jgi:ferric-dicitrate binding protein FerR (iron transport regulator)